MKVHYLFFLVVVLWTLSGASQDTRNMVYGAEKIKDKKKILIIPFNPSLYLSDIDRDLAKKNGLTYRGVRAKFRSALDQQLYVELSKEYNVESFYLLDPELAQDELGYIYNSINYKYEELTEKQRVAKPFSKLKKWVQEKTVDNGYSGIHHGEVKVGGDMKEKYMKAVVTNTNLFATLDRSYGADYYFFINELDIQKSADDVYKAEAGQYLRTIKVHYTIYSSKEEIVESGAVKTSFPSRRDDIDHIIRAHFSDAIKQMTFGMSEN